MDRKKIAVFNTDLKIGGITKSLISFLNIPIMRSYDIDLYLMDKGNDFRDGIIPQNVKIIYIDMKIRKLIHFIPFGLLRVSQKYMNQQKYDLVIDYNGYSNECSYLALNTVGKKHVCWIHNDYEKRKRYNLKFKYLWEIMKHKYRYFDSLVAVSEGGKEGFITISKIEKPILVIPNYLDVERIIENSNEKIELFNDKKYALVSVGALCKAKNVFRQIKIFEEVRKKRNDIVFYIIGDGPLKRKLEKEVEKKKLNEDIIFLGKQVNPYKYMRQMDGLIFNSLYEGQGIVVREAQILGLELFIDSNLQKYNPDIETSEDIYEAILKAKKKKKKINYLEDYLLEIEKVLFVLLNEGVG